MFAIGRHFARSLAWLVLAALLASGCGTPGGGDPDVIKIVSSMPRTGSAKAQTDTIVNGVRIALEEANYRVGPFRVEYSDWDDATTAAAQWTAEKETSNAKRAVRDPDVMVYIGTYNSGAAKISMPILNRAQLLMISPANTAVGLTKPGLGDRGEPEMYRPTGGINYVRVVPADDLQGSLSAAWAKELGFRRVYVLDDNEVYGKGLASMFADACRDQGMEVLGHESIDAKAQEFKSLMIAIREAKPDLIYFGGSTQTKGGQIAKDIVAAGLDARIMAPDACFEEAFIEAAGAENVNGRCYVTFGGFPPVALKGRGKQFVAKYVDRFHAEPSAYAIYGYEAGKVALTAIARAGKKNRQAIVAACVAIKDFDSGALGRWSFDANGDTTLTAISGSIVRDGKFEFVKLLNDPQGKADETSGEKPAAKPANASHAKPTETPTKPWDDKAGAAPPATARERIGFPPAVEAPNPWGTFLQFCLVGLTTGALFALIALGYTMVYGIVEMINFAHGDVFMLGSLLALTLVGGLGLEHAATLGQGAGLVFALLACMLFCAAVSLLIDRLVYKPLRDAPKLAPLVSGVGASFVLANIGLVWHGAADRHFPDLISHRNLLGSAANVQFTAKDLMVIVVTVPIMIGLTLFVKYTSLGRAMRATAQNPTAARLMGINVDRVIAATFAIGGALAGAASLTYGLYVNTVGYQMGFQNGLYAFTAAVLGGIGNIPGAVLGGIVIGLTRSLGSGYVGERWTTSLIFAILILILIFKPAGLLGTRVREKV